MSKWTDVRLQRLSIYRGGEDELRNDIRAALDTISAQFRRAEQAEAKLAEANERLRLCEVPDGWEAWRIKAEAEVEQLRKELARIVAEARAACAKPCSCGLPDWPCHADGDQACDLVLWLAQEEGEK
jgi:hypothetical protein